jgi:hypothetical protein
MPCNNGLLARNTLLKTRCSGDGCACARLLRGRFVEEKLIHKVDSTGEKMGLRSRGGVMKEEGVIGLSG